jgi:hypothetical protein
MPRAYARGHSANCINFSLCQIDKLMQFAWEADNVGQIGCFVVLFALISPRLALFLLWLFTDLLGRAFESWFVPFLGFFLLPWTTLAYAGMWSSSNRVSGFEWFIVVLAFLIDLGSYAQSGRRRARTA